MTADQGLKPMPLLTPLSATIALYLTMSSQQWDFHICKSKNINSSLIHPALMSALVIFYLA